MGRFTLCYALLGRVPPHRLGSLTKEVYTLDEVAALLGVNVNTLYRWRREGRIAVYRLADGQQYRVRREEVARLLGRDVDAPRPGGPPVDAER